MVEHGSALEVRQYARIVCVLVVWRLCREIAGAVRMSPHLDFMPRVILNDDR